MIHHPLAIGMALSHVWVGYYLGTLVFGDSMSSSSSNSFSQPWLLVGLTILHGVAMGFLEHLTDIAPSMLKSLDPIMVLMNFSLITASYYVLHKKMTTSTSSSSKDVVPPSSLSSPMNSPTYHYVIIIGLLIILKVTDWPGFPNDDVTIRETQVKTDAYNWCHLPVTIVTGGSIIYLRTIAEGNNNGGNSGSEKAKVIKRV